MLGGISVDLGPVDGDIAKLRHTHLGGQEQDMGKQGPDRLQKPPPKGADRIVVGTGGAGHIPGGHRLVAGRLNLAGGKGAGGITVKQQRPRHPRVVGIKAATGVCSLDDRNIQLVNDLNHKMSQTIPALTVIKMLL